MADRFSASIRLVVSVASRDGFRVALIGGFALPFHGVRRATGDVDFLVEGRGSAALHRALIDAGADCLHRSADSANYASGTSDLTGIDFIYARRKRAREMLELALSRKLHRSQLVVPVVDRESLIGLKLQAIANAPHRRTQDRADIEALLASSRGALDVDRLRDYYRLFGLEHEIEEWLAAKAKR